MTTNTSNAPAPSAGVRHEIKKSEITVDKIYKSDFQKDGTLTAQIRQVVETKSFYPSKKIESSLQNNIFNVGDFGFEEQEFTSTEERVAWIPVPVNVTIEQVRAKMIEANKAGATIYRVLANEPVLDENQKYAVEQGLRTVDHYANIQAVRHPDNAETQAAGTAGKLTLDKKGNVQYRRTFFFLTKKEDVDVRSEEKVYLSPELKAEMEGAGVLQSQTI